MNVDPLYLRENGLKMLRRAYRLMNARPSPKRQMSAIALEMAAEGLVDPEALKGPCRAQSLFKPRARAMLAMYREGYSYPQIGTFFNRDHSTVMHACDRALLWERLG